MDNVSRAFYEVLFDNKFLRLKGIAFQDFVCDILERRYSGGDFIRVRPWGKIGDRKNDGYIASRRMLLQMYAPNEMTVQKTIQKMEEDYTEAVPYWKKFFDIWTFVHNSREGLGPEQTKKLLELNSMHTNIRCIPWGFPEIRKEIFQLSDPDLVSLLGQAPSRFSMVNLRSVEIEAVIKALPGINQPIDVPIKPIRGDKIKTNLLPNSVAILLKAGMEGANKVEWYLDKQLDKTLGDKIAQSLHTEYLRFKDLGDSPGDIFAGLMEYVGGTLRGNSERESAILAVLAFYFEQCDIFEEPK